MNDTDIKTLLEGVTGANEVLDALRTKNKETAENIVESLGYATGALEVGKQGRGKSNAVD